MSAALQPPASGSAGAQGASKGMAWVGQAVQEQGSAAVPFLAAASRSLGQVQLDMARVLSG